MRIAAIVVTFNRLDHLRVTLQRALAEPLDHLVVVDNGSTDGSREWLAGVADPRLLIIKTATNGGGAAGFEIGLREAVARLDPDWCVLMDDDASPKPGAIAQFRLGDFAGYAAIAAAVTFPDGRICDMNRPWVNPFGAIPVLLRSFLGKGRAGFHLPDQAYADDVLRPVDVATFVGLFLSRDAIAKVGYPDGRLFIYGDDVLYTLALSKAGGRIGFAPQIGFTHDCSSPERGRAFRPFWKTYYHHRNLVFVYRSVAGPVLFWPLIALMVPKWLLKGRDLPKDERRVYRRLIRRAIADAFANHRSRSHAEICALATV
ncbi:MAG: glycosyltransferase [Paracoccaceae bacterium]|nr:glycosyltransferase [Paracoccaceae bacterium]